MEGELCKGLYIKLILATFFWGGTFIAGKTAAAEIGGIVTALYRFILSSAIFLVLIPARYKKWPKIKTKDYLRVFLLGASGIYAYSLFFYDGLQHIESGRAGLIVATNPVFTMLLATIFLGERLTKNMLLGIFMSVVGAMIVFYVKNGGISSTASGFKGEFMMLGCVFSWVAYTVIGKDLVNKYNSLQITIYACFIGTLLLFVHVIIAGPGVLAIPSFRSTLDITYLALLATVVGFLWYYDGIEQIGATRTSQFINLVPITAIIFGLIMLGEKISLMQIAGGALVIGGIFIANKRTRPL